MTTTCSNTGPASAADTATAGGCAWALTAAGVLLAFALSITSQSLWIDELSTALLARQHAWADLIDTLGALGSEAQMPLFAAWMWAWGHVADTSEWGLRAANLPWAVIAVAAFLGLLRAWRCHPLAGGVLLSPFLLYYLNEARPYALGFAGAALALAATERLVRGDAPAGAGPRAALLAGLALCLGASMLNAVLLPALAVYAMLRLPGAAPQSPRAGALGRLLTTYPGLVAAAACLTAAFAAYDLLTLWAGHGGQRSGLSPANLAFALYEMLGFGGLGPPRWLLRGRPDTALLLRYGPWLAGGIAVWAAFAWVTLRRRLLPGTAFAPLAAAAATGALLLVTAALAGHASLWGRHFMALYPFALAALALALSDALRRRGPARVAAVALLALFALSAGRQRLLPEYGKDPLREGLAALRDLQATGPAWPAVFLAYPPAIWYYGGVPGLEIAEGWSAGRIRDWDSRQADYLLFMNRPDILDTTGLWRQRLDPSRAELLWQRGNVTIHRITRAPGEASNHE